MKFEEARKKIEDYLRSGNRETEFLGKKIRSPEVMIISVDVKTYGWIFYYTSIDFVESGKFKDSLTGNHPFLVTKTGDIIQILPYNGGFDEALKKIEREYGLEDEFAKDLENPNQKG